MALIEALPEPRSGLALRAASAGQLALFAKGDDWPLGVGTALPFPDISRSATSGSRLRSHGRIATRAATCTGQPKLAGSLNPMTSANLPANVLRWSNSVLP